MTATQNDQARKTGKNCVVIQTAGVNALPPDDQIELWQLVRNFNDFTEDNDPYGEHDMGKITYQGVDYFWKIDDYGDGYRAEGLAYPLVLTLLRADEY